MGGRGRVGEVRGEGEVEGRGVAWSGRAFASSGKPRCHVGEGFSGEGRILGGLWHRALPDERGWPWAGCGIGPRPIKWVVLGGLWHRALPDERGLEVGEREGGLRGVGGRSFHRGSPDATWGVGFPGEGRILG